MKGSDTMTTTVDLINLDRELEQMRDAKKAVQMGTHFALVSYEPEDNDPDIDRGHYWDMYHLVHAECYYDEFVQFMDMKYGHIGWLYAGLNGTLLPDNGKQRRCMDDWIEFTTEFTNKIRQEVKPF